MRPAWIRAALAATALAGGSLSLPGCALSGHLNKTASPPSAPANNPRVVQRDLSVAGERLERAPGRTP